MARWKVIAVACLWMVGNVAGQTASVSPRTNWQDCLKQKPGWYGSSEAVRIADNVLLYQRGSGGWPKNIDMAAVLGQTERARLIKQETNRDSTIDNGATYTQMAYLARVFNVTGLTRFKAAFIRGVDYLLRAQYENGGWPQYYPEAADYSAHITFNDDAMIGVMELLREIAQKPPAYAFVDEDRRRRSEKAVSKGIECVLKCQIVMNGKRTVWCAQHDERTLEPAPARTYEKVSLSSGESVGIVRFLMRIDQPSPQIIEAVQAAVSWFDQTRLTGIKVIVRPDDTVVVDDPKAGPLWARFYEIGTNRPIFCGRDGVIKYNLAEIERERRTGYRWYVDSPVRLLTQDYPAWRNNRLTGSLLHRASGKLRPMTDLTILSPHSGGTERMPYTSPSVATDIAKEF